MADAQEKFCPLIIDVAHRFGTGPCCRYSKWGEESQLH